jgi:hypothetical protein
MAVLCLGAWRVEIGILAHLALDFLPLLFVIEQNLAIAEVGSLDFALRSIKKSVESGYWPVAGELLAAFL